jgi:hypothetical protein
VESGVLEEDWAESEENVGEGVLEAARTVAAEVVGSIEWMEASGPGTEKPIPE